MCGEIQGVYSYGWRKPLDFLTFGQCMERREQIANKVMRGHGGSAHDARG